MPTARQAPQFTLRAGPGLALIEDLRRLRDWYLALCHHRQIVADAAHRQNHVYVVSTATGSGVKNVIAHQGTRYNVKSGEAGDDFSDYELAPADLFVRQPGTTAANTSSSLYNHPAASPRDRPPYKLPRPIGLVLKAELIDFQTWATSPGLDTPSTSPPAAPAKPKPKGLALRADLIALAEHLAAG